MWLVEWSSLAVPSDVVLLLHHIQGLGAVKELTICLALLGVKDVQSLFAIPLRASKSSPCMYYSCVVVCSMLLTE